MLLMGVLCVFVAGGLAAIWRWGSLEVTPPWLPDETEGAPPPAEFLRRYFWYLTIGVGAGIASGVVMIGAGGRLVMRLLGAIAGDAAQGRLTEADEVVGEITLDGTIGFITFFGIFGGLLLGLVYMLIRRWLPPGRWGGLTYGAGLLVVLGTRFEPLRADNPDFEIVGPDWLSVLAYTVLALCFGMLLATLAGLYSRALPALSRNPKAIVRYAPFLMIAPAFGLLIPLVIVALLGLGFSRANGVRALLLSARVTLVARVLGAVVAAVALPQFVMSIIDILRG